MNFNKTKIIRGALFLVALLLSACSGGGGAAAPASSYIIGGALTGLTGTGLVLQNNAGDNLTVNANGAFSFATNVASGAGYSVTVKTQPSVPAQNCIVGNGSGTVSATSINSVAVTCSVYAPRFAYVANQGDSTVSMYTLEAATGKLRNNGYVMAGQTPQSVTVDPSNKYVYVVNSAGGVAGSVSQYTIGTDGRLTPMIPVTVATGIAPQAITIDPSGKYAYVANSSDGTVSQYTIGVSGALTALSTPTVAAGVTPYAVEVDPSGRYAYVANSSDSTVWQYSIATNGVLTPMIPATVTIGTLLSSHSVTVDPSGKYAYVANTSGNSVSQFTIGASGALTAMTPATVATGSQPYAITIDPSGKYAYVGNSNAASISQYTIGANGALTPMVTATVPAGQFPYYVIVDPASKYAYVANYGDNNTMQYTIAADGSLTFAQKITGRRFPYSLTMTKGTTPVAYTPKFAYVSNFMSNSVSGYTINASTGALTSVGADVAAGAQPASVIVDLSGKFAYVANGFNGANGNSVSAYTINATSGALTSIGAAVAAGLNPKSVTIDPSGKFAYVANITSNDVSAYTINASTGALTQILCGGGAGCNVNNFLAGTGAFFVTVDPSGRFVYVANNFNGAGGNSVSAYTINSLTGALTSLGAVVAAGTGPVSVTVDASGKFVYVANQTSNDISAYTINSVTGALTQILCGGGAGCNVNNFLAGAAPNAVTVDRTGRFAYVANYGGGVSTYSINATTGALTSVGVAVAAGNGPISVTIDPSGKYAYVANWGSGDVSAFSINATTGALTSVGAAVAAGTFATSVTTTGTIQ